MAPEVVLLTTYPPQECGIATFSQDLIQALNNKFQQSFSLKIALLEDRGEGDFPKEVAYGLNAADPASYVELANTLNETPQVALVLIQHEFGFYHKHEHNFITFLRTLDKPAVLIFHTVLPHPDEMLRCHVMDIADCCAGIVVMTEHASLLLINDYAIRPELITVIQHGTHLVLHADREELKAKFSFEGRRILSTFGLLSSGKNIEMTLNALPAVITQNPDVLFLIIGKTHPAIVKNEGESYRESLKQLIIEQGLENHVQFVNRYLSLEDLLDYLQLTDLYLFTSKDPNQAVSGTFSYALSCGCPIISTPIPHAQEVLQGDTGIIVPIGDSVGLAQAVNRVLGDITLWNNMHANALHRMAETAWENAAISYALLFQKTSEEFVALNYRIPSVNLHHMHKLTTDFGMIQFSKLGKPDIDSGYTIDDNARAMIAMCHHYELTADAADLPYIQRYLRFITYCLQPKGYFLNYVDEKGAFTDQNFATNLADSNGRAIWALGYLISMKDKLPAGFIEEADRALRLTFQNIGGMYSTRAMAFAVKGLYYYHSVYPSADCMQLIPLLANRLVQMYRHEARENWEWFESYLTYANSVLPEALLCAYEVTGDLTYHDIARTSFDFLLSQTFHDSHIRVISNRSWLQRGEVPEIYGEQPIDIAYTVMALSRFYRSFKDSDYLVKLETAFNWFLGHNHLHHIIYNPCTGGCWDGLEEKHVNLNQGAESTVSYLMARLTIEDHLEEFKHLHKAISTASDIYQRGSTEKNEQLRKQLKREIVQMTTKIVERYPELYRTLTETQLFTNSFEDGASITSLSQYVEFLKGELNRRNDDTIQQPVPVNIPLSRRLPIYRR